MKTVGAVFAVAGFAMVLFGVYSVVIAGTDTYCFAQADFDENSETWSNYKCSRTDCDAAHGGGECKVRAGGASSRYPGYNYSYCGCDDDGGIKCELAWLVKEDQSHSFAACPNDNACDDTPNTPYCNLEEEQDLGGGVKRYSCECQTLPGSKTRP